MDYQKYLKYKTKYLLLKKKLTQLGGAKYIHDRRNEAGREFSFLITELNITIVDFVRDIYGLNIRLEKNEVVDVTEQREDTKSGNMFGKVVKNGITGWIEMKYLKPQPEESTFAASLSISKASYAKKKEEELSTIVKAINDAYSNPLTIYKVSIDCNHSNNKLKSQEKTYLKIDPNEDSIVDSCFLINGDKVTLSQILRVKSSDMLFGYVTKNVDSSCNGWVNIENLEIDYSYALVKLTELPKVILLKTPGGRAN
jgi:hypothetical protein